ncbi:hypothetical protein NIES4071_104210 (plasmid) [Calothrix sp. NIES-4071]|nr:hypothetical protein NIES4071_104210 [Calothrix sp. NIES-4071]BAZ64408.1 hypothetical protein NIES4105_101410 [Calothrix sp. NIES-4105]
MRVQQVRLIYFKASGKYYSEAILNLTKEEIEGSYYTIGDRIRELSTQKSLPGIVGDWLGENENGFTVVMPMEPDNPNTVGYPVLVKNQQNQETFTSNDAFTPGAVHEVSPKEKTKHIAKVYLFKQHGKYDIKYEMPLDSECITENVALTYKISDMYCSKYPNRSGYAMFSCPETLYGCPHLILPSINSCLD